MARTRIPKGKNKIPTIFIFSNGETEIEYFKLKKADFHGIRHIRIEKPYYVNETKATKLVKYAKKKYSLRYDNNPDDVIFCLKDMDDAIAEDIDNAKNQMPNKMKLIISNPDFEFWFLLHYRYHSSRLSNREPIELLRGYESTYQKPKVERIYNNLKSKEETAITHAGRLRKYYIGEGTENFCSVNPYTNVDEMVSYLNSLNTD